MKSNRRAQEALYKKYSAYYFGLCIRYISNRDEAEECLSNGFIKIFEKINTKHKDAPLKAWMTKIMVNECLQEIRKKKEKVLYLDDISVDIIEGELDEEYDMTTIFNGIKKMPIGYRTIFNLYVVEGYKHKEIAEILDIAESTSKSQYLRAKKYLLKELKSK